MNNIETTLEQLRVEWRRLNEKINRLYGTEYPKVNDCDGWKLLGRIEGLTYAIVKIEKLTDEH